MSRSVRHPSALGTARLLLLPAGIAALLAAIAGGLARLGAPGGGHAPVAAITDHGALAVHGFLGVLVAVERAVAIRRPWPFASPLLGAAGTVALLGARDATFAAIAWTFAALVALVAVWTLHRRQPAHATRVMLASCVAWAIAGVLWGLGLPLAQLLPWWAAFLVLMIVGERVQFGRLAWVRGTGPILLVLVPLLLLAAALGGHASGVGTVAFGAVLVVLGAWLLHVDVRRRARRPGLLWFVTVGLTAGYAWLVVSGVLWALAGAGLLAHAHDALVHALFQGFVLGMVLAHAPMIFPAVTGLRMPFHRGYHIHLALLHAGLLARVGGGLVEQPQVARVGSTVTALALVLFVAMQLASVVAARVSGARTPSADRGPRRTPRTAPDPLRRRPRSSLP